VAGSLLVGTFHSVCNRMLHMYGAKNAVVPQDFSVLDQSGAGAWVKRIVDETRQENPTLKGVELDPKTLLGKFGDHKNEVGYESRSLERGDEKKWRGQLDEAFRRYEAALRERGLLDFADLLHAGLRLATVCPQVQKFAHVSVDGYQNCNGLQLMLIKQWTKLHANVLVVGDMEQSIYTWRVRRICVSLKKPRIVF
jgi:DNA helicase-2/ATP-dependent DNA helicase PcrA